MAVDFIISIAAKIGEYLVAPVGRQLGYLLCYKSNIEDFRSQVGNLGNIRVGVQGLVDDAERNGEVIEPEVKMWLASVDRITEELEEVFEDELKESKRCFNVHCPDLKIRYQQSRKAKKQTAVAGELKRRRQQFHKVSYRAPPPAIGSTFTEVAEAFESRKLTTKEIMEALRDDQINMIGIYGMGGVGKTTLVKEVSERAKDDNVFDEIVMAVVSQPLDIKRIQGEIADMLGLTFQEETVSGRAGRLSERLKTKKRILVILDDIWARVELETIGIPFGAKHKGCKILLTSRSKDVCSKMDTQKNFLIGALPKEEAWNLFQKMAGDSVNSPDLRTLAVEVAKECAGLPLAIVTVARALKNRGPSDWRDTASRLRKSNPDKRVFESLELSYNYLESEEAKSFFLLCSLFPEDHNVAIQDLLKYGMGLGLFQDVDTVEEAIERAHRLASDLKSSCLLLDGYSNENVKMHDVVRDVAIKIASKGKHVFLVRAGPVQKAWLKRDAFEGCTAISLMSDDIDGLPDGLECPKLQLLLLACSHPSVQFPDNFFLGMKSLKVLSMSGMHNLSLSPSLRCLKNLQTLCLDRCSLKDLSIIGELKKLEILSFRGSKIKELPKELRMLTQLRLLDLTRCDKLTVIPPDVIRGLSQLEGLYMGSFDGWEIEKQDTERSNASLEELKYLPGLTTLEINISDVNYLPEDLLFEKLSRFKVSIGTSFLPWENFSYSKILALKLNLSTPLKDGVKVLMKKAEYLHLIQMSGLKNVLYDLDTEGFQNLKCLNVKNCDDMEYIFNTVGWVSRVAFPVLEKLDLSYLANLKGICHGQLPTEFFCQLQELRLSELPGLISMCKDPAQHVCFRNLRVVEVSECNRLKYLFSHSMAKDLSKLVKVEASWCKRMEEIFGNEREAAAAAVDSIMFPHLHSLELIELPNLRNFRSKMKFLDTHKEEPLFDNKVSFPNLEILRIDGMINLEQIWHNQSSTEERYAIVTLPRLRELTLWDLPKLMHVWSKYPHGTLTFQNLCSLRILNCDSITHVFSPSIARGLVQLQTLRIDSCKMLKEIIAEEREGDNTTIEKILFPQLRTLDLEDLPNLMTFSHGSYILDITSLVTLRIIRCHKIKAFDALGCLISQKLEINAEGIEETECDLGLSIRPLVNEKVAFLALVELVIDSEYILKEMWDPQLPAKSFSQLKVLKVEKCQKVLNVVAFNLLQRFQRLKELSVEDCDSVEEVVELEGHAVEEEGHLTGMLSQLRTLRLRVLPKLKHMWWDKYPHGNLGFQNLSSISIFKCYSLKSLFSPSIASCLVLLQEVAIDSCEMMETVIENKREGEENCVENTVLPQLQTLKLKNLPNLMSFYTGRCILNWSSLKDLRIEGCLNMKTFISRFSSLQKLLINDEIFKEAPQEGKLHDPLQPLFDVKASFPALKSLVIDAEYILKELWHPQLLSKSFSQLEVLEVKNCHKVLNVITFNLLQRLQHLENLSVEDCDSVEELVELEGHAVEEGLLTEMLSQLGKLKLSVLPKLKHMWWDKYPQGKLGFQNLSSISIFKCYSLKSLFSPSIARSLVLLREVAIDSCDMMEMVIENKREEEEDCVEITVLPQLQTLKLKNLPNLMSFYTGRCTLNWPSLKYLLIEGCLTMKTFISQFSSLQKLLINDEKFKEAPQKGKLHDPLQPLFDVKVTFLALEKLESDSEYIFKEMWHPQVVTKSFSLLEALKVKSCHKMLNVVPFDLLQRLDKLREFSVEDCGSVEEVVETVGHVVEDEHVTRMLSQLRTLRLGILPKLKFMWWDKYPHGFQNLSFISICKCHSLKSLFSPFIARSMVQLQTVEIDSCEVMETIIAKEREGEENCAEVIVFQQLETLELKNLANLMSFYMRIKTSSPKLETNDEVLEVAPEESNQYISIQPLFDNKVTFPTLEELKLEVLDNLNSIWHPKVEAGSFHQLRVLKVKSCHKLLSVVPSNLLKGLKNLEEVSVVECDAVEIIFEIEGPVAKDIHGTGTLSQLKKLELQGLPKLFASKHPILQKLQVNDKEYRETPGEGSSFIPIRPLFDQWVAFNNLEDLRISNIENLQEIFHTQLSAESFYQLRILHVSGCHKLSKIASSNLLSRLENLEELVVNECNSMEEIFEVDGLVGKGQTNTSLFQLLKKVELHFLPNLTIFSSGNYNFTLPSLEKMSLVDCSKMQTFSSGFINTPKLNAVTLKDDEKLWKDDLNSTVQHLLEKKGKLKSDISSGQVVDVKQEEEEREKVNQTEAGNVEEEVARAETSSSQAIQHEGSELSEAA